MSNLVVTEGCWLLLIVAISQILNILSHLEFQHGNQYGILALNICKNGWWYS